MSTAYHPESQGTLERFHQTLKSMWRTYCIETGKDWVDGLPLLMLAIRSTVQESLGFSPAELVFGHTVWEPLKLISEQFLSKNSPRMPVFQYVSTFHEYLHKAWEVIKRHLANSSCGRLSNSAILSTLPSYLSYLSEEQRNDITELINKYPLLLMMFPHKLTC